MKLSSKLKKNLLLSLGTLLLANAPVWAGVNVLQSGYDLARTGANLQETILNASNVNSKQFGQLFSYPVDGDIYAQPLYVSDLKIPGKGTHDVVFVATMNDVVYAFDADSDKGLNGGMLWLRDFRDPAAGVMPVPAAELAVRRNIERNVGIESTPLIDLASQTLYLVARTKEKDGYFQRLHALDLTTGQEKSGGPVVIQGSYQGLTFDPKIHNQRPGLALAAGQIIITWAAHQDLGAYHGWVMAYDGASLAQTGIFSTTTTVIGGGIWASGRAPAVMPSADGTGQDIILFSGNSVGTLQGYDGLSNLPESMIRLNINPGVQGNSIRLVDWFTPTNWQELDLKDNDLGGSGPLLLPGSGYIIGGGKEGRMYVVDPNHMGKLQENNPGLIQSFRTVGGAHIMGGPVVWDRSSIGKPLLMYNWREYDTIKAFTFDGTRFDVDNFTSGKQKVIGHPGGILTLSANGAESGSGIVWSLASNAGDAIRTVKQGILRAYDAENVSRQLWNSRMDTRDDSLAFAKFTPPTVANGKVYVATFSNRLLAYGLLPNKRKSNQFVMLLSRVNGKALEVPGASLASGTRLQVNEVTSFSRQRWELKRLPHGGAHLVSVVNRLLLDNGNAGQSEHVPVQVWQHRSGEESVAQYWKIVAGRNGYIRLISRQNKKALTLSSGIGNIRLVTTEATNGNKSQEWLMRDMSDAGVTECNTSAVQFISALPWGRVLTVGPDNTVVIDDWNTLPEQTWKMIPRINGGYEFSSVTNDLVLSSSMSGVSTDIPLTITERDTSSFLQEWRTSDASTPYETYVSVDSVADGNVLTVPNRGNRPGTQVISTVDQQNTGQIWRIQDTNSIWCSDF